MMSSSRSTVAPTSATLRRAAATLEACTIHRARCALGAAGEAREGRSGSDGRARGRCYVRCGIAEQVAAAIAAAERQERFALPGIVDAAGDRSQPERLGDRDAGLAHLA